MLDRHELAAGKLAALFGRTASRDLFGVQELLMWAGRGALLRSCLLILHAPSFPMHKDIMRPP